MPQVYCIVCGANPAVRPLAIFRLNNKGQVGVWACEQHYAAAKQELFPHDDPNAPSPVKRNVYTHRGPWTGGTHH